MGSVRRNTAKDNVVLKAILHDLERFVSAEAITDENPWFLVSLHFGLGVKHPFDPLQADLGVGVSRLGARVMSSRGGICGPVALMGCGWPDDHWKKRPTICAYALDRSYHFPFNTGASVSSQVVLTY
jgi:hypothetical protein